MLQSLKYLFKPKVGLLVSRPCSSYVSRTRYLMKLKENDEACRGALQSGSLVLYHKLAPLLQRNSDGIYQLPALRTKDVEAVLEKLGKDKHLVNEAVLIGCNEREEAQFCLDVGQVEQGMVEQLCGGIFVDLRKAFFLLKGHEAPLVARGQALLRWHKGHGFCSATGQPTVRNQSGSQRVCRSSGLTYYPTMAPVVIVLVSDGSRCLLGRQATFPRGMYSALAGFCDMGETVEETVRREIAEEVGLEVLAMRYSGSQHWPFPNSSFMVACQATVSPEKTQISLDEEELEDARWFTADEVTEALKRTKPPPNPKGEPPVFWFPPNYAIAHRLIREWARQQAQPSD